jgi:hypothetical protein
MIAPALKNFPLFIQYLLIDSHLRASFYIWSSFTLLRSFSFVSMTIIGTCCSQVIRQKSSIVQSMGPWAAINSRLMLNPCMETITVWVNQGNLLCMYSDEIKILLSLFKILLHYGNIVHQFKQKTIFIFKLYWGMLEIEIF